LYGLVARHQRLHGRTAVVHIRVQMDTLFVNVLKYANETVVPVPLAQPLDCLANPFLHLHRLALRRWHREREHDTNQDRGVGALLSSTPFRCQHGDRFRFPLEPEHEPLQVLQIDPEMMNRWRWFQYVLAVLRQTQSLADDFACRPSHAVWLDACPSGFANELEALLELFVRGRFRRRDGLRRW
jgi:hypothetical protein